MFRHKSNRGSVLLVALMFAAILAISLTSYLKLALNTGTLANRTFYFNAALNLTDTGLEQVIWSLNDARNHTAPATANWTNGLFTIVSSTAGYPTECRGTFPSPTTYYPLSGGAKGQVKVWVGVSNLAASPTPEPKDYLWHAVAQATITLGDGTTLQKMAECYIQQRSYAGKGMVARDSIKFTGNGASVDSWRSRYPAITNDVPYSTNVGVRRAAATIAAMNLVAVQSGDIYGYVSLGENTVTGNLTWQANNGILTGTLPPATPTPNVDLTRVTCDFATNFPDVEPIPSGGTSLGVINTGGTVLTGNGNYTATSISIQNSETFEIGTASVNAHPTLVVSGSITLNASSKILIHPGSSLTAYVGGNISMVGQNASIVNGDATVPANPDRCLFLGTQTAAAVAGGQARQDWDFGGNGNISAMIYAPNGNIQMHGNGHIFGAMVGNNVTMSGNGSFHQDESLSNFRNSGLYGLSKWRQLLTDSERAAYATQLNF